MLTGRGFLWAGLARRLTLEARLLRLCWLRALWGRDADGVASPERTLFDSGLEAVWAVEESALLALCPFLRVARCTMLADLFRAMLLGSGCLGLWEIGGGWDTGSW